MKRCWSSPRKRRPITAPRPVQALAVEARQRDVAAGESGFSMRRMKKWRRNPRFSIRTIGRQMDLVDAVVSSATRASTSKSPRSLRGARGSGRRPRDTRRHTWALATSAHTVGVSWASCHSCVAHTCAAAHTGHAHTRLFPCLRLCTPSVFLSKILQCEIASLLWSSGQSFRQSFTFTHERA